ncbi:hypothetical protein QVD17_38581 [Tagetes erecta]|uniref:Zinc finger PHD-type domain-containing protein n=1 Tax=Tagetes erecta TaxID=13708 RepID=A0AAD8JNQ8_TARER|nr:hypothetical protein QVD17_38581 [Tagetes erecta]
MESSDDEGEIVPGSISEYYFNDKDDEPLSFSKLPVQLKEGESSSTNADPIFLGGKVDNGLDMFYQQVKAWKYDILTATPEISVLSKDNHWIKLEKPRKSYENLIRSILISVHCLCFFKSKPDASGKSLWDHLSKVFSLYDNRPSENDLIDHINFIREAVKRDDTLANSKFLVAFLENPRKRNSFNEEAVAATKPSFIVDDINGEMQGDDIASYPTEDCDSDGEDDHFDSVCAICDNGGSLTCCEGKCFRSFHATPDSEEAQDSSCESLCLSSKEVEDPQYKCENCKYSIHQCFVCAELGSSDKSSNAEVFRCSSATCGHFYHPKCVAKLLQQNDKTEQQTLKEKIAAGEPFICPAHKCAVCKQTENEKVEDMQFAICRRCPKSYHRKCLPRDIMFEHQIGDDDDDEVRAWDGLLAKSRALIYCVEHGIDSELATPARKIIFRNVLKRMTEQIHKKKLAVKVTGGDSVDPSKKKAVLKSQKSFERSAIKPDGSSKKRVAVSSGLESSKKKKVADASKNSLRRCSSTKVKKPSPDDGQPSLGSRLFDLLSGTESNNLEKDETFDDANNQTVAVRSQQTEVLPSLDDESKQRIMLLMREAISSVTLDEVKRYHLGKVPSTHAQPSRVDKSIILSRVEGSVEALKLAAKKLEEGCSVEDAMAVCKPGDIDQLMRWKDKLSVYLAPFLRGMRYSSFGRHFTKVEKLEKIVDKLHWYIEDGDTIVDFCCGANDFSCLMKKRLDETGKKKCSYKNYDIARPKNDFNFEKRDWMKVSTKELPSGSRLVMGLNPPFGIKASLANKFIENALLFKPKLIILIVPRETERLDSSRRTTPYDLIWEDVELLAGKSFYLPGSVDVNDKQIDKQNKIPPVLYLWSRPSWTNKHKSIAEKHGHLPQVVQPSESDEREIELGLTAGKVLIEDSVPFTINEDSKTPKKPKNKKRKKESPGGTESKSKQVIKEGKGNQNSSKKIRLNQESKTEKHDMLDSNCQDQPQKLEEAQAPVEAPKRELTRATVEARKPEITRAPVEAPKCEITRAPVDARKPEITRAPVEAPKCEITRAPVEALKHEVTRAPVEAPKHEITQAPVEASKREVTRAPVESLKPEVIRAPAEAPKHEIKRAPVEAPQKEITRAPVEVQKHELARASSRETEVQKRESTMVPSRELGSHKHEKSRTPSRDVEDQKHDKSRVPSQEIETQKHEKTRVSPREMETSKQEKTWGMSRDSEAQRFENKRRSPHTREFEAHKHEKSRVSPRGMDILKHGKTWGSSREPEAQKFENKRPSPRTCEDKVQETLNADFSFVDVDQSEGRYSSAIDESTFSLQNDLGPSYDHLIRKYSSANDEPYMSSTSHRRLDSANHTPPGYSVRHDHLQYPAYDRVASRGSFSDEMGARIGGSGGYSMARHDPGLTRYGSTATTPYNRTSTSATQRYAPRLDEMNHVRVNNVGRPDLDELNHVRMGGYGRSDPHMGSRGVGGHRPPENGSGFRLDSMGFAPGPYHPYQHNSSAGWLND